MRQIAWGLFTACLSAGPVHAVQQAKSLYSTIEFAKCQRAGDAAWRCTGLPGYPLYVSVGQTRTYVSVGPKGERRRAAKQSLAVTNTLFDKSSRSAVEWRFVIREKRTQPYATIVRYFTKSRSARGEVVVVSRVTETETCQVARIDALANDNAMVLARAIADRDARTFDCSRDPVIVGATGRSPM